MKDMKIALRETILEILRADPDPYGLPLVSVVRQTRDRVGDVGFRVDDHEVEDAIQDMLDSWEIDKVVSYLLEEDEKRLSLPLGLPTWHLRLLAPDEQSVYRTLDDEDKAVIRLLQRQNEPERLGQISFEEGRRLLIEQGFSLDLGPPEIEGKVRGYMVLGDAGWEWWFGLIDEGEKDPHRETWND